MLLRNTGSTRSVAKLVPGLILCIGTAALLSILFNDDSESRVIAPWICLLAVVFAGMLFGRLSGLVGSLAASLTFAVWLFPPVGSLAVQNSLDLGILLGFQLIGVGVASVCPPQPWIKADTPF